MTALATASKVPSKNGSDQAATVDVGGVDDIEEQDVDQTEERDDGSPAQRRRPVKYPEPKVLPDINFSEGDVPLKTFMEDKKPKSHNQKFLASAAWFKLHGHVEEVTLDHVYTAYQAMEWKSRKNMVQPFYAMKDKGWITQGDNGWKLTHIGLDKTRELPAGE
jgi:hypothetical protein